MSEYTVLPLLNSAFKPGTAVEVVERFEDSDFRNIARAELFYFSGRAKECCEIAESYLEDEAIELRLSACILYGYSNLSLGNSAAARRGLEGIQECMKLVKREGVRRRFRRFVFWPGMLVLFFCIFLQRGFRLWRGIAGCFRRGCGCLRFM